MANISSNPVQPRSSVAVETLQVIQQASENEATKEALAIQKAELANQAQQIKNAKDIAEANNKLEVYKTESANAMNERNNLATAQNWHRKNQSDAYMQKLKNYQEQQSDIQQMKLQKIMMILQQRLSQGHNSNNYSASSSINSLGPGLNVNLNNPDSANQLAASNDLKDQWLKKQADLNTDLLVQQWNLTGNPDTGTTGLL